MAGPRQQLAAAVWGVRPGVPVHLDQNVHERRQRPAAARLAAAYDQPLTLSYRTVDGTATTGDYIAKTGTLTFAPGETTKSITIEVKGDSNKESDETFYLDLSELSSNALFTKNRGLGTILNDD